MVMLRVMVTGTIVALALASATQADNRLRIFVPANAYHSEQQLVVGQPGEIFIEITNDVPLYLVWVSLGVDNPEGGSLWDQMSGTNTQFLLADSTLTIRTFHFHQNGVWPDTVMALAVSTSLPQSLPPGTHLLAKMRVTPTASGTVVFSNVTDAQDGATHFESTGGTLFPQFLAENITVIQLTDCNANGVPDEQELAAGTSFDCNVNGFPDECDIAFGTELDCNLNGVPDACDLGDDSSMDCNVNLIPDECEIAGGQANDCNANGIPDDCDPDLDSDGIPDDCEAFTDCNSNGVSDVDDILSHLSADSNGNGVPDECEGLAGNFVRIFVSPEGNHAGQDLVRHRPGRIIMALVNNVAISSASVPFRFYSSDGTPLWAPLTENDVTFLIPDHTSGYESAFVNRQGGDWPDTLTVLQLFLEAGGLQVGCHPFCEMSVLPTELGLVGWEIAPLIPPGTTASYVTADGHELIAVELQAEDIAVIENTDCNDNGVPDSQDIMDGTAFDCNVNGFPDECDIAFGTEVDCNLNGVPDACDLGDGSSADCNVNLIPDECEIAGGQANDCNANGIPDDCDSDLDSDGIPDDCEVLTDCNVNGVPDAEDIITGFSIDNNANGVPDECEGLAGNYFRIYVPHEQRHESQQLVANRAGSIIVAVVNNVEIAAASASFRYNTGDGTPLWPPFTEQDGTFLLPGLNQSQEFFTNRQTGGWPDTLALFHMGPLPLPVGFHPILRLSVTPNATGAVTIEAATLPSGIGPTFVLNGIMTNLAVDVRAEPITVTPICCVERVGNIDEQGEYPDEVTLGDIMLLVDAKFISGDCSQLPCLEEADVNQDGGVDPNCDDHVTLGDIIKLVDFLFITGPDVAVLPDCL